VDTRRLGSSATSDRTISARFDVALLRAGVNVKIVSEALGHSRPSFTMDTLHARPAGDGRKGGVGDRGGAGGET
jgi:hypothetical protein